jgi:hypothetical protein
MLVKAKILETEVRLHKGKDVCDVTIKVSDPAEAITCTLWNNSVSAQEHRPFMENTGKDVFLALSARVWQGNLQYSINSQAGVIPVKAEK